MSIQKGKGKEIKNSCYTGCSCYINILRLGIKKDENATSEMQLRDVLRLCSQRPDKFGVRLQKAKQEQMWR